MYVTLFCFKWPTYVNQPSQQDKHKLGRELIEESDECRKLWAPKFLASLLQKQILNEWLLSAHWVDIWYPYQDEKHCHQTKVKTSDYSIFYFLSVSSTPQWRRMLHNSPNFANKQLSDQSGNVQGLISTRSSRGREREKFQSGKKQALVHNLWSFCCYDNPIMENNYLDWLRLSKKTTNHGIAIVDVFFKSPLVSTSKFKSSHSRFTI